MTTANSVKKKRGTQRDKKDFIFVILMSLIPMIQFLVFYVYVNFNSVLMAFQTSAPGKSTYVWYGLGNFKRAWLELTTDNVIPTAIKNSAIYFCISLFLGITLSLIFSFYIYKKYPLHSLYKVMLFLPSILSSIVMILLYKYFVDFAIPKLINMMFGKEIEGLLSTRNTMFGTVMFYCVWCGFGTGILMYSGAMNGISESLVEAAQLDGANLVQEFCLVTIPMIFPTLSTFIIIHVAGFFTAEMGLFSFFGEEAERYVWTIGYYLLRQTKIATIAEYPYLACLGLIYTVITLFFTTIVRWALNKYGPSTD